LEKEWLTGSVAGGLIEKLLQLHHAGKWDGPHDLLTGNADEEENRLVSELTIRQPPSQGLEAAASDCLVTLERTWVERELRDLRKHLNRADLEPRERDRLLSQVLDLQPRLRNIPALSTKNR
jgi:hypothetical protein